MSAAASRLWTIKGRPSEVGAVVVVIQPDLPDGDPFGRGEEGGEALVIPRAEVREVGGVESRRKVQCRGICAVFRVIVFRHFRRERGGIVIPARVDDGIHPRRRDFGEQGSYIAVFIVVIQVCVRVDVHIVTIVRFFAPFVKEKRPSARRPPRN